MRFLVVQRQSGGCDYTIGCGVAVSVIEARDMRAAVDHLKRTAFSDEPGAFNLLSVHEGKRDRVQVFEVVEETEIPLDEWREHYRRRSSAAEARATEARERAQLAALRAKYG